ncbi:E3 31 kDa [Simian adenovirus 23]|uniref:E3 31 kDa n=1 Tax=Simian adenovirus 23 TaxID=35266 RepID=Q6QPC9_9ADEN|nr:E3 31 kDa [Simian adenovirus 23]
MKAVSALVFCSLIGIVFNSKITRVSFIKHVNVTEGDNITLAGVEGAQNTTWTKYHLGWRDICTWNVTYYCIGVNLTIVNANQSQNGLIKGQSVSVTSDGYYTQHSFNYNITVIPLPTPSPPSTTTQTTTYSTSNQPTTTTAAEVASSSGVRVAFLMLAPSSSPTASTNEQTTEFLSTVESHTTATSSAFSSTANLSSLSSTPISPATTPSPAPLPTPLKQTDGGMQWQITLLIVIGLVILAVLLYYIFCRRIPNAHRKPAYKPIVIGQPEPLQVEGGLRNLLFSFTVW